MKRWSVRQRILIIGTRQFIKIQKVFLNALMKYQTSNPFRKNANENVPLPLLLRVIKLLKDDPEENDAGVFRSELSLIICWANNDAEALYQKIKDVRHQYGFTYGDEVIYDICLDLLGAGEDKKKRFKIDQITGEAVDEFIRKMRITGIVSLRGNGRFLDFNSFEIDKINYILQHYSDYPCFTTKQEYFEYMGAVDSNILTTQEVPEANVNDVRAKTLNDWATQNSKEDIIKELQIVCGKGESKNPVLRLIDKPTRFEFLTSIALKQHFDKRDELLRQLAFSDKEGIPAVAQLLDESVANPTGLENAVYRALSALGFETQKLGGNGKPDGFASANLGYDSSKALRSYTLTYDAKSTQSKAIAAGTAKLSGIKRHQNDYKATYSLEVAIDFEGGSKDDSAIAKEARDQKVTLMRVKDLAKLVLYSVPKQLSLTKLKELFETCYTPEEVSKWVNDFIATEVEKPPYNEIISIIYTLQKEDTEPPTVSVIRRELNAQLKSTYSTDRVAEFMKAIENIVPSQFHFDGEYS